MAKDWTGNYNSIFKTLGATSHSEGQREENDYYATEPKATELLLEVEKFQDDIWECACGEGHMSEVLKEHGYNVVSTDLIDRGYEGTIETDFLASYLEDEVSCDIITNPPYKYAREFVEKAMEFMEQGYVNKVAMFLKVQFLEGQRRRELFKKYPPRTVYVSSGRLKCAKNGDFESTGSSAVAYAWYVWEKGFNGKPTIDWIN